ncbi:transposase [Pseudomonas sp. MH9.3]|uniref:IS66-like element accessory protein TnpA n=2 Tax=Pseudomonas sp. MH9.3 TaxID=3048630 RepID=UPI002B23B234|nr:transposase [Pseudomonas sp. MH9.3]MEB0107055.1 transposase [Pseudomonas sp. MH9.3]WQG60070.1 transposase [Pseudomonas sp. RTB3]
MHGHHHLYCQDYHAPKNSYPKPFKAQVVQECLQPGMSMASVALGHGINANLVRKWIPACRDHQASALPAFVPMKLAPAIQFDQQMPASIEIPFGQQKLNVHWRSSNLEGCVRFICELAH